MRSCRQGILLYKQVVYSQRLLAERVPVVAPPHWGVRNHLTEHVRTAIFPICLGLFEVRELENFATYPHVHHVLQLHHTNRLLAIKARSLSVSSSITL